MSDFLARIQLVQLEVDRLHLEAQRCTDPERMTAIRDEMDVLLESMREIRREQLMKQIDPPPVSSFRRGWRRGWRFWRPTDSSRRGRDS